MKRPALLAFTLIEMLTVMAVIAILASLIVAVNAYAHKKAALVRADGEIHGMASAAENYKGDFGTFPRDPLNPSITDSLDPREHGDPTASSPSYRDACLFLYKALSGDAGPGINATTPPGPTERPDGKPETKSYFEFPPTMLRKSSTTEKTAGNEILYIQDPFGNSYGYSTAGALGDGLFREELQKNPEATRGKDHLKGFNPTFDLWSTGGQITKDKGDAGKLNEHRKRWIKNW